MSPDPVAVVRGSPDPAPFPLVEFNVSQSDLTRGFCGGALSLNKGGTVAIPACIGLGVSVDEDFIAAHRAH